MRGVAICRGPNKECVRVAALGCSYPKVYEDLDIIRCGLDHPPPGYTLVWGLTRPELWRMYPLVLECQKRKIPIHISTVLPPLSDLVKENPDVPLPNLLYRMIPWLEPVPEEWKVYHNTSIPSDYRVPEVGKWNRARLMAFLPELRASIRSLHRDAIMGKLEALLNCEEDSHES